MKKFESFESSIRSTEISRLIGSNSQNTSSYTMINDCLVRISNHYPVYANLSQYNDLDKIKGILFVFVGENADSLMNQMEEDYMFNKMNIQLLGFDIEENDSDYIIKRINKKISLL